MLFIFVWKKERNIWHFSVVKDEEVLSCGLRSEMMIENRAFGFWRAKKNFGVPVELWEEKQSVWGQRVWQRCGR